ncbi:uncharacterized protein FAM110A [Pan troglodytes]
MAVSALGQRLSQISLQRGWQRRTPAPLLRAAEAKRSPGNPGGAPFERKRGTNQEVRGEPFWCEGGRRAHFPFHGAPGTFPAVGAFDNEGHPLSSTAEGSSKGDPKGAHAGLGPPGRRWERPLPARVRAVSLSKACARGAGTRLARTPEGMRVSPQHGDGEVFSFWVQILALPSTSCMTLSDVPVPPLPSTRIGNFLRPPQKLMPPCLLCSLQNLEAGSLGRMRPRLESRHQQERVPTLLKV